MTVWLGLSLIPPAVRGGDLGFGDPANVPAPPTGAIGFPSRAADFDALPGFRNPPPGYGDVAFFWWVGDPLTKERLTWELNQLAGKGVMGLQINYAHSDKGGRSYGLTYPSHPPLFSAEWWDLVHWFVKEARKRGMAVSLSDYTLGFGQGWYIDEILKEDPSLNGATLAHAVRAHGGGTDLTWKLPEHTVSVTAFRQEGGVFVLGSAVDLRSRVDNGELRWAAPEGQWQVVAVHYQVSPWSLDPMNPKSGTEVIRKFFQPFEDRNPGQAGKGLNFFFSDELGFGVNGNLWTSRFADEFKRRKGYDLVPELATLFVDIGPRTPKVRLDYRDVMVALEEESFFKPVFDWHQQRGMIYGCDHGGRGYDVVEFGDYYRAMRWYQGPGNDQPHLGSAIVRTKVSSSIGHLYERPRCWLEGFYGSGWGTTPAQVADATFKNFALGANLLTLHGLYYTTHGGYWEWAPPCNHFHMPYWPHMGEFLHCAERLGFLLSQGVHRCDVAVLYPVAAMEAGMDGDLAVKTAFAVGERLISRGIDVDYIDFESVARAQVVGQELRVSGEAYRVLVLPAMKAVRFSTLEKARELHRAGGKVVAVGALPQASDRVGRDDAELAAIVRHLFGDVPAKAEEVEPLVNPRDYSGPGQVLHRVVGSRDVYFVYGVPKNAECSFRARGKVELWNPWTGESRPLPVISQDDAGTRLHAPLEANEPQLFVFSPGAADREAPASPEQNLTTIALDGDWEFELNPSLDNRFGDFHWPPTRGLVGPEIRQLEYAPGDATNGPWQKVTCSFGPQFWKLGPVPDTFDEARLVSLKAVDPLQPVEFGGRQYRWQPYEFSWRWGKEGDPGHQGWHGLKENVTDEFLCLGAAKPEHKETLYGPEPGGTRYFLWTSVHSQNPVTAYPWIGGQKPAAWWLNRERGGELVKLKAGSNPLLLRYDAPGRGYFVMDQSRPAAGVTNGAELPWPASEPKPLAMTWWSNPSLLPFDVWPETRQTVGFYRFTAPPGLRGVTLQARGKVRAWAEGQEMKANRSGKLTVKQPSSAPVPVVLRIEPERGFYGGAALPEYIRLDCGPGRLAAGDWSKIDGLRSYSGGAWYRKRVTLPEAKAVTLDLGKVVATAEVFVNGRRAGVRVAPPWTLDLSRLVRRGDNRIEVRVYNTLANHYTTIPTHYPGDTTSGLLGPVQLRLESVRGPEGQHVPH